MNNKETKPAAVVVNDDTTQLGILSGLLARAGVEARAFESAEAALTAMWTADPPDLVVTDLYMPGIDGWRFCRLLRSPEYESFNEVPILVVSATFAGDHSEHISADVGADAFLPSPVDGKAFTAQIKALLTGKEARRLPRTLIVEDGKTLAGLLKKTFAANGYRADVALTVREAEAALAKTPYNVAVLDYHLPDGTGEALLDALQTERPDCVCLMMTTDPTPELALDWMKRGAAAYLRKPFEPEFLIELSARARRERALLRVQDLLEVRTRELRESEEHLSATLRSIGDGVVACDREGKVTSINRTAEILTGWTSAEAAGRPLEDVFRIINAQTRETADNPVVRALAEGVTVDLANHTALIAKDGTEHQIADSCAPIRNASGAVSGAVLVFRDVTEAYRRREELRASEEQYRLLVKNMHAGVVVHAPDTQIILANEQACRLLGLSLDQMTGKTAIDPAWRFVREDETVMPLEEYPVNHVLATRQPMRDLVMGIDSPATEDRIWVQANAFPELDADGRLRQVVVTFFDITERKRAEEENRRFKIISDNAVYGKAIADLQGNLLYINRFFAEIHGYSPEELIGRPLSIFHSREQMEAVDRLNASLMQEGHYAPTPVWHRHKDGTEFPMLMSGVLIKDDGNPQCIAASAIDITAQHQAQANLAESEETHRALVEGLPDTVMRFDREGRHLFVSDNVRETVDMEAAQFIGKTHAELGFPEAQCRFWEESIRQVFDSGAPSETEFTIEGLRQAVLWPTVFNWRLVPERDAQGAISSVLSISRDITARRKAEQEYRTLFREMLDGFALHEIILDTAGTPVDYRFLAVNPAFERMTGLKAGDIVGRTVLDVLPGTESHWIETYGKVALTGEPVQFRNHSADLGKYFEVTAFRPAPGQFACIFQDITERKRAEEEREKLQSQLNQAQKMESVGRLAGGVAHDFNNMLGVILGHSDMILEEMDPDQPFYADLTEIRKAGERSADLTRQLLAFARKQTVAPKVIDLNKTVTGMTTMLKRLIGENIDLAWIPDDKLWSVKIDPSQIDQILANLCVNARDAIADVGKVTIETSNTVFDEAYCKDHSGFVPGEYARLAVSDSGCGMDAETLDNVFEPFFTTKESGKGTGLGLATVYGVVKQNQGFINIYSEPGQGTTFKIYLPRHLAKTAETEERKPQAAARGSETILLVEDEPAILRMTTMMLEREGYTVVAAGTPGEAIELAHIHSGEIHLLMTDVVMPEMNGRDLARNILSHYPNLKRLFMSGYTANVIAHHGVLDEGVNFIQKPFSKGDLAAKVREALERE